MKKYFIPILVVIGIFVWLISVSGTQEEAENDHHYQSHISNNYKVFALSTPEDLSFAGEKVPVDLVDIKERVDRDLMVNTYWQSQTLLLHKRANRWFPTIEPILKKNGVPDDFKYLCVAESALENAVSPAKAVGFWQFLKDTGRSYGLEINDEVDERYNLEKSTEAACKYLNQAYKKYGSWSLAAASYNMGMNGLDKQLSIQKVNSYYDLLLGEETKRYVFRILAMKEVLTHSNKYGFHFRPKDLYEPYKTKTINIDYPVKDWADFANERGINYKILKLLNPWLRKPYLNNKSKKLYTIKLPLDNSTQLKPHITPSQTND